MADLAETIAKDIKACEDMAWLATKKSTDEYIDSAIARNIQHSLKYYQYGGHFRHLAELFEKDELTSAINRVVEDINHRFTISVLTDDFISHEKSLDILNKPERSVIISDDHRREIKEYLDLLDLTVDIPTEFLPVKNLIQYQTVVAQPGLRYSQAKELIWQLLLDEVFQNISIMERADIFERILGEIMGRMMEEIVLLETKMAYPKKNVFKLQFPVGEFDMVVSDPTEQTEFRYGKITGKTVIYRGDDTTDGDILYKNVEDHLKKLLSSKV